MTKAGVEDNGSLLLVAFGEDRVVPQYPRSPIDVVGRDFAFDPALGGTNSLFVVGFLDPNAGALEAFALLPQLVGGLPNSCGCHCFQHVSADRAQGSTRRGWPGQLFGQKRKTAKTAHRP